MGRAVLNALAPIPSTRCCRVGRSLDWRLPRARAVCCFQDRGTRSPSQSPSCKNPVSYTPSAPVQFKSLCLCGYFAVTRLWVMACTESAMRFCTPTLRISLATWAFTVRSSMPSTEPISLFERPVTSSSSTPFSAIGEGDATGGEDPPRRGSDALDEGGQHAARRPY